MYKITVHCILFLFIIAINKRVLGRVHSQSDLTKKKYQFYNNNLSIVL